MIGQALAADVQDPVTEATVAWNGLLIGLHVKALADQVDGGVYPLLENAFYGDYDAAVDAMRPFSAEQIWGPETPLVVGTAAEGWEFELSTWISQTTNLALRAQPDLAPALFLRAWGAHLRVPGDVQAVSDVERAAELAPDDPLFTQSAAYLQVPISVAPPPQPITLPTAVSRGVLRAGAGSDANAGYDRDAGGGTARGLSPWNGWNRLPFHGPQAPASTLKGPGCGFCRHKGLAGGEGLGRGPDVRCRRPYWYCCRLPTKGATFASCRWTGHRPMRQTVLLTNRSRPVIWTRSSSFALSS